MIQTFGKAFVKIAPIVAIVLVVAEIIVSNSLASARENVSDTDAAIERLQDEHDILSQEVASASALATIEHIARDEGFITPQKSQYIVLDTLPVAANLTANTSTALH